MYYLFIIYEPFAAHLYCTAASTRTMHTRDESPAGTGHDTLAQFDLEVAPFDDDQGRLSQRWRSWAKKAAGVGILLLPSFLHDTARERIPLGVTNHPHHYEPMTESRRDTAFLDGMRGLAAFCVFLEHFFLPFWSTIFFAYGGDKDATILQLPVIRLLSSGSPMVCIFFVISGTALTLKPAQLIQRGEWDSLYRAMESMIFRRGVRLFAPSLLASFVLMIAAHLHLCDVQSAVDWEGPAVIKDEFWLKQPQYVSSLWQQIGEWLDFVIAKVLIPSTWRGTTTGRDYGDLTHVDYGSQLWTVAVEYWASILLFAALVGTARLRAVYRIPLFTILSGFSLWVSRWDMALFLYGSMLTNTSAFQTEMSAKTRTILQDLSFVLLLCLGLHLASAPELGSSSTPGFVWLSTIASNPRVWQSIGGALIVTAVANMRALRRIFSCSFLLYLGRISYALYVVHIPLLVTMGWRLVPAMWRLTGRESWMGYFVGIGASLVIVVALLVWAADLYCRFVDEPCTAFARRLETYLRIPDS